MPWNKQQKKEILDSYWASSVAYCPDDNARLDIQKDKALGHKTDLFFIRCPRCQQTFNSDEIEPEPQEIDEFTNQEKKEIVDTYFATKTGICPRDGVTLKIEHDEHTGGWFIHVRCPRCGRVFQWTNKDDEKSGKKH